MAAEIDSLANEPETDATSPATSSRAGVIAVSRTTAQRIFRRGPVRSRSVSSRPPKKGAKPVRSLVILTMVAGLIATVALPAYGAFTPAAEAQTLQQVSADDAQSFVVASDASAVGLTRDSYAATTSAEIEQKKAEEAAAAAAKARAELQAQQQQEQQQQQQQQSNGVASVPMDYSMVSAGSGVVRWPIHNFTQGRGLWDSGYHQGVDLLAPAMTPLYAAAAGVVTISGESVGGYGVAVSIDHVINGQSVNTLYGHMTYGSRQVSTGQAVSAGQLIGFVGSTGSSTANHVHFEVHINGGVVDPWAWLVNNAS